MRGAQGDGDRRRDGDHRRLRLHHARGRLHQPGLGDAARRRRRAAELRLHRAGARAPAWTRRSTCSPRTASPASPGSCSSASSPRRAGTASPTALFYGNAGAALGSGAGGARRAGVRVRRDVRAAEADRRSSCRCAPASARRRSAWTSSPRRGGVRDGRGRDPRRARRQAASAAQRWRWARTASTRRCVCEDGGSRSLSKIDVTWRSTARSDR